jgi:acetoin utilization deacetylase AcuC-like enzyme
MNVFWNAVQASHQPRFFLVRGQVRANFEAPARAEALLGACHALGLPIIDPLARASMADDAAAAGSVPSGAGSPVDASVSLADSMQDAVNGVHDAGYLRFLRDGYAAWSALAEHGEEMVANAHAAPEALAQGACPPAHIIGQLGWYTADTACPIGPATWNAAIAAAACAIGAADDTADGRSAYALARPPGHHAYRARAGGHCYLNNAAIAAERLRAKGATRVAVLDIDSHHGNGTQGLFWERADVLFVSLHGDPSFYYPWFTGHAAERGGGPGTGCNLNLPLPLGSGDDTWLAALSSGIAAIARFRPDALVVSLGFDASRDEPLNALSVSDDGFARAGAAIAALRLPTALVQEGGYAVDRLGALLTRFLTGFGPH